MVGRCDIGQTLSSRGPATHSFERAHFFKLGMSGTMRPQSDICFP
jgi:hypothetical protein